MRIDIVCASAGTGKTTELTRHIASAVAEKLARPERILATTFSRRAAGELLEGARRALLERGHSDEAQALRSSLTGTVNSVCDRVIRAFAFDLGISPDLRVIADDEQQSLLAASLSDVLGEEPYASDARDAAHLFGLDPGRWTADVASLVELARQNGIHADRLDAIRSLDGMLALLDPPDRRDARQMDADLADALRSAVAALEPHAPKGAALTSMRDALARLEERRLPWTDRIALAQLRPGKTNSAHLHAVVHESLASGGHPALRTDLQRYVYAVFHFAKRGLERYRRYKRDRRLLDFIDQEELALTLLDNTSLHKMLRDRIDLVLVDEFQDTSPLQLAIFTRLRRLAPQSVWVGDPKQSIYGFRGADPVLMRSCVERLATARYYLTRNYRSHPTLVRFVDAAFRRAFGLGDEPSIEAVRSHEPSIDPLSMWLLQSTNKADDKHSIAAGLQELLGDSSVRVVDRVSGQVRRPVPGDVAVLCGQNDDVSAAAAALARVGIPTSVARTGLLSTREGRVAQAALRTLLDPANRLAAGILSYYTRSAETTPDAWLSNMLGGVQPVPSFASARTRLASASPSEVLDLAIDAAGLAELCLRWGRSAQRLANLEQLRTLARAYERGCANRCVPATAAGLDLHLQHLGDTDRDVQGRDASDAVSILTCHASKGLEWPIVILADLDRPFHPNPFGLQAMPSDAGFDPDDPLKDRWIRLWVSPFGSRTADIPYVQRGCASAIGQACAATDREQELRVLYVALTRARDRLILAVRETDEGVRARWLQQAPGESGEAVLSLPSPLAVGRVTWTVEGQQFPLTVARWGPVDCNAAEIPEGVWFEVGQSSTGGREAARLGARDLRLSAEERERICALGAIEFEGVTDRMKQPRSAEMLGRAVHAFLAADRPQRPDRGALARRLLHRFGEDAAISADELVSAADRLEVFVNERYPQAVWHREVPIAYRHGDQEIHGIADLLLECPSGWVVIDHKTYVGPAITWTLQAEEYLPQLEAYSRAVEQATSRHVIGVWLHFPLAGGMLQVVREPRQE